MDQNGPERDLQRDLPMFRFRHLSIVDHHYPPVTLAWFRGFSKVTANGKTIDHIFELAVLAESESVTTTRKILWWQVLLVHVLTYCAVSNSNY